MSLKHVLSTITLLSCMTTTIFIATSSSTSMRRAHVALHGAFGASPNDASLSSTMSNAEVHTSLYVIAPDDDTSTNAAMLSA